MMFITFENIYVVGTPVFKHCAGGVDGIKLG